MHSPFDWSNGTCLEPLTLPAALRLPSRALLPVDPYPDMWSILTAFLVCAILPHVLVWCVAWSDLYKVISSYMYVFFYDLLVSLDIELLRFIQVEVWSCGFFVSAAVQNPIVWIYSTVFVAFPVNRYLGYWHFSVLRYAVSSLFEGPHVQGFT